MQTSESTYITIGDACHLLGISPNTLRSWGAAGKITEYRHPMNNYRLFRRTEIERLRARLSNPRPVKVARRRTK